MSHRLRQMWRTNINPNQWENAFPLLAQLVDMPLVLRMARKFRLTRWRRFTSHAHEKVFFFCFVIFQTVNIDKRLESPQKLFWLRSTRRRKQLKLVFVKCSTHKMAVTDNGAAWKHSSLFDVRFSSFFGLPRHYKMCASPQESGKKPSPVEMHHIDTDHNRPFNDSPQRRRHSYWLARSDDWPNSITEIIDDLEVCVLVAVKKIKIN